MVVQEDLDRPAALFDPDDLLENVRESLDEELADSADHFADDTLLAYMSEYWDSQVSAGELVGQAVKHAMDRYHRRPTSGHEKAQVHACKDDPVGLRLSRQLSQDRRSKLEGAKGRSREMARGAARGL